MGNARVSVSLLLRLCMAKEIHNTKCWVSTSISEQFQFRWRDAFTTYMKFILFLKKSAVTSKDVMIKVKLSFKCKDVKRRNQMPYYWKLISLLYRTCLHSAFPYCWFVWSQWECWWKWLGMQSCKCFCFKRSIFLCNAVLSNRGLLIFTANRRAVFP